MSYDVHAPVRTTRVRVDKRIARPSADCVFLRPLNSLFSFMEAKEMFWVVFEILLGLGLFLFIIWWTMPKKKK